MYSGYLSGMIEFVHTIWIQDEQLKVGSKACKDNLNFEALWPEVEVVIDKFLICKTSNLVVDYKLLSEWGVGAQYFSVTPENTREYLGDRSGSLFRTSRQHQQKFLLFQCSGISIEINFWIEIYVKHVSYLFIFIHSQSN